MDVPAASEKGFAAMAAGSMTWTVKDSWSSCTRQTNRQTKRKAEKFGGRGKGREKTSECPCHQ